MNATMNTSSGKRLVFLITLIVSILTCITTLTLLHQNHDSHGSDFSATSYSIFLIIMNTVVFLMILSITFILHCMITASKCNNRSCSSGIYNPLLPKFSGGSISPENHTVGVTQNSAVRTRFGELSFFISLDRYSGLAKSTRGGETDTNNDPVDILLNSTSVFTCTDNESLNPRFSSSIANHNPSPAQYLNTFQFTKYMFDYCTNSHCIPAGMDSRTHISANCWINYDHGQKNLKIVFGPSLLEQEKLLLNANIDLPVYAPLPRFSGRYISPDRYSGLAKSTDNEALDIFLISTSARTNRTKSLNPRFSSSTANLSSSPAQILNTSQFIEIKFNCCTNKDCIFAGLDSRTGISSTCTNDNPSKSPRFAFSIANFSPSPAQYLNTSQFIEIKFNSCTNKDCILAGLDSRTGISFNCCTNDNPTKSLSPRFSSSVANLDHSPAQYLNITRLIENNFNGCANNHCVVSAGMVSRTSISINRWIYEDHSQKKVKLFLAPPLLKPEKLLLNANIGLPLYVQQQVYHLMLKSFPRPLRSVRNNTLLISSSCHLKDARKSTKSNDFQLDLDESIHYTNDQLQQLREECNDFQLELDESTHNAKANTLLISSSCQLKDRGKSTNSNGSQLADERLHYTRDQLLHLREVVDIPDIVLKIKALQLGVEANTEFVAELSAIDKKHTDFKQKHVKTQKQYACQVEHGCQAKHGTHAAAVCTGYCKRDIKVMSLKAARVAKRREQEKEAERKLRKEEYQLKLAQVKKENKKQLEINIIDMIEDLKKRQEKRFLVAENQKHKSKSVCKKNENWKATGNCIHAF